MQALHQTNEKDDVDVRREVRPQTPAEHRGHGKPLFFQPPALRKAADAAEGTGSGSSTDRPLRDRGDDPADHPPTPSDIEDLEDTNRAAERGEAPKWQVTTTDEEAQMQIHNPSGVKYPRSFLDLAGHTQHFAADLPFGPTDHFEA